MQDFFVFFLVFSLYFVSMKKILLYWLLFFCLFFGTILIGYWASFPSEVVIGALFCFYFLFQGFALKKGLKWDKNWIYSGIVIQLLFAVLSPLYYSNFWDPVYEFVTGEWFGTSNAFEPCQLCWWARILMFPLLPLMLLYISSKSRPILWYIYGASGVGIMLEVFHYLLQKTSISNPFGCTLANPCKALWVEYFNFITIPFLCLTAFLIVHILVSFLLFSKKLEKNGK